MSNDICFDASVAVKWILVENGTSVARRLLAEHLGGGGRVIGPPHLLSEVTSAVYKRITRGELSLPDALERINAFSSISIELFATPGLAGRAIELADRFGWSFPYDAFYLALGDLLDCDVWTADGDFHRDAHGEHPRLRMLSDYAS